VRLNGGMQNLLPQPAPTLLPEEPEPTEALAAAEDLAAVQQVAARFPSNSAAWGRLAALALAGGDTVTAYAYARTGYHRGLDQLRRNGWRGAGPVPWSHEPNRGFLQCLYVLGRAADIIGETEEAERCAQFLHDCDPAAAKALAS
jgi:hypothetical protein